MTRPSPETPILNSMAMRENREARLNQFIAVTSLEIRSAAIGHRFVPVICQAALIGLECLLSAQRWLDCASLLFSARSECRLAKSVGYLMFGKRPEQFAVMSTQCNRKSSPQEPERQRMGYVERGFLASYFGFLRRFILHGCPLFLPEFGRTNSNKTNNNTSAD